MDVQIVLFKLVGTFVLGLGFCAVIGLLLLDGRAFVAVKWTVATCITGAVACLIALVWLG